MSERCVSAEPIGWPPRPGQDRERLLEHLSACDACRARWASEDPSRLFALLALDRPSPGDWEAALDAVSDRVRSAVAATPRREAASVGSGRSARIATWVAIAAGVLLAAFVAVRGPRPVAPERAVPVAVVESTGGAGDRMGGVEWISGDDPSAERIDFRLGDTQVTMILDKGLEL